MGKMGWGGKTTQPRLRKESTSGDSDKGAGVENNPKRMKLDKGGFGLDKKRGISGENAPRRKGGRAVQPQHDEKK